MNKNAAGLARLGAAASVVVAAVRAGLAAPAPPPGGPAGCRPSACSVVGAQDRGARRGARPAPRTTCRSERSRNPPVVLDQGRARSSSPLLVVLLVVLTFAARPAPPFGRHVYAVGGNAEAARRAGINVAADQAVLLRDLLDPGRGRRHPARQPGQLGLAHHRRRARPCCTPSARPSSAAPACSAARAGSVDAVIGGLVIAVIDNGMGLLNQPSGRRLHGHRPGAARRGQRRRAVPAAGCRHRPRLTGSATGADVTGTGVRVDRVETGPWAAPVTGAIAGHRRSPRRRSAGTTSACC